VVVETEQMLGLCGTRSMMWNMMVEVLHSPQGVRLGKSMSTMDTFIAK
jgi:hypothetical protein